MSAAPGGNYASGRLPEELTIPGWRVALIIASFTFSLPGFLNNAQAGLALGLNSAVLAALCAGFILCAGACLTAVVSVRTRLTTYTLVQRSFGLWGAALVNIVIAIIHFCWFGVNVSFFGDAMVAAARQGYGFPGDFNLFVVVGSVIITLSTIWGFKTLDRLAMIAVPFVGVILIALCVSALGDNPAPDLGPVAAPPAPMSFGIALSSLVGGNLLTVAAMPDLSRFIRTERGAVSAMLLSFPFCAPVIMLVSALIALATGQTDIMMLVVAMGFGVPALAMLVLSVWTINALNLYSAGLSMAATFPRLKQGVIIIVGGAIGCLFALLGIINGFIPFLIALGLIIPPIAAIYVIDGFMTFRGLEDVPMVPVRWEAIGVWLGSLAVTLPATRAGWTLTTVPALDATLLAAFAYLAVLRLGRRRSA
ncbi:MAG: cytosine permease [Sphingopyxis sp.]|uniref:purine-cytosine permease family protein n=1 Tax=Sphingopyxis sp. TaxID=1908224 RepID=UPI001A2C6988|nr:cytosine permease [Sphingopyxis sp.]MBJ7498309.1 cytosine permease [Sphingopyxis sp.]